MIKRRKSFFSFLITGVFTVGLFANTIVVKAVEKNNVGSGLLNPLPQSIVTEGKTFDIGSKVTLIGADKANENAVRELKELLKVAGIEVQEGTEASNENTNIYIGELEDDDVIPNKLSELGVQDATSLEKAESYVLVTKDGGESDDIVLAGKDERGTYYAVQTLEQLLTKVGEDVLLEELNIVDSPSMRLRGSIEGFYGAPWSHQDRLEQLEFYGENKMNTYIYAPKDDPYHREKWREKYPAEELDRMQELIDKANAKEVDFVFAISPGETMNLTSDDEYNLLEAKLQQMYDMGVRSFAVFFDDISSSNASGQAHVLNRVQREFIETHDGAKPLIMVPTEYVLGWTGSYTNYMAANLDEDILVMWTGNDVVPVTITKENIQAIKNKYTRNEIFIWWNYNVNDYCNDQLLMGPTEGLDLNLDDVVAGLVSNPMNESEASKPTLYTVGDYTWNTKNYDRDRSWDNALRYVGGEAYEGLKTFTEHTKGSKINNYAESVALKPILSNILSKWQAGEDITDELNSAKAEFNGIITAEKDIRENINNDAFIGDVDPYLTKLSLYGEIGLDVLSMIEGQVAGDMNKVWENTLKINSNLRKAADMTMVKWENHAPVKVTIGSRVLDPFMKDAVKTSSRLFNDKINGTVTDVRTPITSFNGQWSDYVLANMVDGDINTFFWSNADTKVGDYVGINLGKPQKINNILIEQDRNGKNDYFSKGQLEYSLDGQNWTEFGDVQTTRKVELDNLDFEAQYIRYRALENQVAWLQVFEFDVNVGQAVGNKEEIISNVNVGSLNLEKGNSSYIIEGSNTILNLSAGDYIGIKLPEYTRFDGIDINFDKSVNAKVQYSTDGRNWDDFVDINGTVVSHVYPFGAKYVRVLLEENASGVKMNNFTVNLETKGSLTASTNMPTYGGNTINKIVDGNDDSFFWSSAACNVGDYVQVDLGKLTNVRDITLIMTNNNSDYIAYGQMKYSLDGNEWFPIGNETTDKTVVKNSLDINARYLRYEATKYSNNWAIIREFKVNTEKAVAINVTGPEAEIGFDVNQILDKDFTTAYKPAQIPTSDTPLLYRPGSEKAISAINIFQDAESICDADVQVLDKDNNWVSVGKLQNAYNKLEVDSKLGASEIRIVWAENGVLPVIYELVTEYEQIVTPPQEIIVGKVQGLKGSADKNTVTLNWEAPKTSVGLVEYIIYKDGKEFETVSIEKAEYTVENLKPNTIYGFKIVAKYSNGEVSKPISINIRTKK